MKRATALLAISLASCTTSADHPDSRSQLKEESDRFAAVGFCHSNAAWDLDDGHSDAAAVAYAVRSRCSLQEMQAAITVKKGNAIFGQSPGDSPGELEQNWENDALEAVLQERRDRGSPSN